MREAKVSNELFEQVQGKLITNPNELIPVIVSLNEGVDIEAARTELSAAGFQVERVIPGPVQIIAGHIQAKDVVGLAQDSKVRKMEYDGKTFAVV